MALASLSDQDLAVDGPEPATAEPLTQIKKQSKTVVWTLGTAFVLLVVIAIGSFVLFSVTRSYSDETLRQQAVMLDISRVNSTIRQAESGQRGYLLVGLQRYLDSFTHAREILPDLQHRLLTDLGGDGDSLKDAETFISLTNRKIQELQQTVDLKTAGKSEEALAIVRTDHGLNLMHDIGDMALSMIAHQRALVVDQSDKGRSAARLYVYFSVTAALLIILLATISTRATSGLIKDLRVAQGELEGAKESLEQAVEERTADLREANEELQRYAYIVSHDLRSPLVNVMGFTSEVDALHHDALQLLARSRAGETIDEAAVTALGEDFTEAIGFIKTSTDRMERLIAAILKLAREGRRNFNWEMLDMNALVQAAADTISHRALEAGAEIKVGLLPRLSGDRLALDQVIGNLLDNALKYLKPGRPGRIEVSGRKGRRATIFQVSDNGRGIDPKDHQRVFELFRRSGDQTVPGEGIGLAHVRALVRAMGGVITCESELGSGTTFTLRFPHRSDISETRPL